MLDFEKKDAAHRRCEGKGKTAEQVAAKFYFAPFVGSAEKIRIKPHPRRGMRLQKLHLQGKGLVFEYSEEFIGRHGPGTFQLALPGDAHVLKSFLRI
jgi:hypothetical protein